MISGFTVSIVTNEPSAISSFVTRILFPLEFVTVIENVAFPLVSPGKTVVVNVVFPPLVVFVNDLPSKVPVKLPRSVPSVTSVTVMILPVFAKLLPEELAILRDVTVIGSVYNYTYTADADTAGNPGESMSRIITITADPITVTSLSIASSSGNNFANTGKIITVTLVTDGTDLGNFTGTLLGRSFTNTTSGGNTTFTTTVLPGDTNGNATFSITVTNSSGNRILVTNDDIADGSFVTIDTVKPLIILNGNSNDTVLQGNNYTDLGANVYDLNNPSYTENVTATTNLNTSLLGVQNITYSALADTAGNVPDSINRTVTVLAKPLGLVTLTITNNNAVNSLYAKAGDFIDLNFVANGTIGSGTVTIASNTIAHISFYDERFVVSYILASSIADTDSLEFTITVTNEDNTTTSTFTEANLTGPSIIIDNTAPTITLVGNNNTIVYTNSSY